MFCFGIHVETVVLLTRKKDVGRIDIEMTVEKEDVPKNKYLACSEEKVKAIEEALKCFGLIE